jgi:hypothetical protein
MTGMHETAFALAQKAQVMRTSSHRPLTHLT